MKPRKVAEIVHGGILLALAVMMGFLLFEFRQMVSKQGISSASIRWFPAVLVAAIIWLVYRGTKIILAAWKDVE
ncbi:MAG: hypothetical protein ACUVUU_02450 [bacterium]